MNTNNLFLKSNKIIVAFLFFFILFSFTNKKILVEDDLLGVYLSPNKRSKIEFVRRGELFYGRLIWNVNPKIKDLYNPDHNLKNKNLVGQDIFKNFKYNKYARNWTGKFYDAESGCTYNCNLWFENAKKNLMAKGYIESPIFGVTRMLKRINK